MDSTRNPPPGSTPTPSEPVASEAIEPITRMGIETVLSKYPIHNLSTRGMVDIEILRTNEKGKIDLHWKVSPNPAYGLPRSLAYKLDTLVINRRIDEERRPLPEVIKIGSLRDVARDLGLGNDTPLVKNAFLQNASAFIKAKLKYRGVDGAERTLEAGFTRYSVVFTGEKLPNGKEADAVFIVLNKPYHEILNNAPIRPLNYEYLKALAPTAQRFYEIISPRIYATIKNKNPYAKLLYSEYCMYSAQLRYFDHDHFKKQMYKVHRPHLQSGYLAKVHYEKATDAEDKEDWMMCYTPGPKARAEYMEFARRNRRQTMDVIGELVEPEAPAEKQKREPRKQSPRQGHLNLRPAEQELPPELPTVDTALLSELTKRGIGETDARALLTTLPPSQPVLDQLEWGDYQVSVASGKITNPPGFYISLLQRNVSPPPGFETSRARAARLRAEEAREKALQEAQAAAALAEEEYRQRAEAALDALDPEEYKRRFAEVKVNLIGEFPFIGRQSDADNIHRGTIRARMINQLVYEGLLD